jgi:hypothetical protein
MKIESRVDSGGSHGITVLSGFRINSSFFMLRYADFVIKNSKVLPNKKENLK